MKNMWSGTVLVVGMLLAIHFVLLSEIFAKLSEGCAWICAVIGDITQMLMLE